MKFVTTSPDQLEDLLCIDLYAGLGGWAEGFLSEGYKVKGYDIEKHDYGTGGYPGELFLRNVLDIHGSEFADATVIVGSSPCQKYSYMAMPWKRSKELAKWYADPKYPERLKELNALFDAQFRIQREACEAAGRYIPLIVENVRGAVKWVSQPVRWHFGSYYLWGDMPALMPITLKTRMKFDVDCSPQMWRDRVANSPEAAARSGHLALSQVKVSGIDFNEHAASGQTSPGFNVTAAQRYREGVKFSQSGDAWFDGKPRDKMLGDKGPAAFGSKSNSRKVASALIAKIPFPLAQHIARTFKAPIL